VEAPEREAALLELSLTLCDARLLATHLAEDVPEMCAVAEAIRHAGAILGMVWDLHERTTSYRDSILDLGWGDSLDD
jgi:hypothetical protein